AAPRPGLGAGRKVDRGQLVLAAREPVLGPAAVADLGVDPTAPEDGLLVRAKRIPRPDQPMLVRIDDRAVRPPELYAHDVRAQDSVTHDAVDLRDCRGLAAQQRRRDVRLDDPTAGERRDLLRVADRLALADVAQQIDARRAEEKERGDAAERVLPN